MVGQGSLQLPAKDSGGVRIAGPLHRLRPPGQSKSDQIGLARGEAGRQVDKVHRPLLQRAEPAVAEKGEADPKTAPRLA